MMGIRERRADERKARWQQIVKAARRVFFEKGYLRTTIEDIERGSNLTRGAIYYYFKGKEEIYVSVLTLGLQLLRDELQRAVSDPTGDPHDTLEWVIDGYCAFYREHREYYRILQHFFFGWHEQSELGQELVDDVHRLCRECLEVPMGVLRQGVEEGCFVCGDPFVEAVFMWGAMTNALQLTSDNTQAAFLGVRWEVMTAHLKKTLVERLSLAAKGRTAGRPRGRAGKARAG